jgi:hypothetical protein
MSKYFSHHGVKLLRTMRQNGGATAGRVYGISNANAYFVELEKQGLCKWVWCVEEDEQGRVTRRYKWRFIPADKVDDVDKILKEAGDGGRIFCEAAPSIYV